MQQSINLQVHVAAYSLHFQMTTNVDGSCRDDFIGTSAACPLVSGTIALTLQAK